jgi:hypothetical protein
MKPKEYSYYNIDIGFFPRCVKLCFNNDQFQDILCDQKLTGHSITALEIGVAETHYIGDGKKGIIVVVFNLDDMTSFDEMIATIAHETVHIIERISDYIEEEEMFSEETRAYLTESIVRQIFKACIIEKENHVGKTPRAILQKIGRKIGGSDVQVDQHGDGGARQDSIPKRKGAPRRTKSKDRKTISKADTSVPPTRKTRLHRNRII